MNWTEEIPSVSIELQDNGNLRLEDKSYADGAIIDLHPCQVRLMAERLGIVRNACAEEAGLSQTAGVSAAPLRSSLERLIPWLEMIEARADQLHDNIMASSMRGHEDLNIEVAQSSALADIAEQVLNDARAALSHSVTLCHVVSQAKASGNSDLKEASEPASVPSTQGSLL